MFVSVEEMLGIKIYFTALADEVSHRLADKFKILFFADVQRGADMEQPALAEDRHNRCFRFQKRADVRIRVDGILLAPCAAKGGDARPSQSQRPGAAEELHISGIRSRPAAFDVLDTKFIE